jgi:hemerythrin-like metal-binding protein
MNLSMLRTWLDDQQATASVYAALAFIYVLVGLLTLSLIGSGLALLAGLTLIMAGLTTLLVRRNGRHDLQQAPATGRKPHSAGPEAAQGSPLVQIAWRNDYACGNPTIDAQHRQLFDLGNDLINAALRQRPRQEVEALLDKLSENIADHFCTEEAELARAKHPFLREQKISHRALLEKARALRDRYRSQQLQIGELIGFLVYDVVTQHIVKEDLQFSVEAI